MQAKNAFVELIKLSPRLQQLQTAITAAKQPRFRMQQLCNAIYNERRQALNDMTNFPKALRSQLCASTDFGDRFSTLSVAQRQTSTQFKRQLTADEITDQVLYFLQQGHNVDSISFMGMGEPLANPNTFKALKLLSDPLAMTIDTIDDIGNDTGMPTYILGVVQGIRRLNKDFPTINLAFSLHTPFAAEREHMMPITRTNPLPSVFEALDDRALSTNKKIFIAYLVLEGFNDSEEHARATAELLVSQRPKQVRHLFHVNLLRYNPIADSLEGFMQQEEPYKRTSKQALSRFQANLRRFGVNNITLRQSFGMDIDAACGQLFAKYENKRINKANASSS